MTWKEKIPFIAVEPGVPVIPVVAGCGKKPLICLGTGRGGKTMKVLTEKDGPLTTKATNWRVDLDNPIGFMYALSWLYGERSGDCYWQPLFSGRVDVIRGDYSKADINSLVKEMRCVFSEQVTVVEVEEYDPLNTLDTHG
jgi:hypothetical protein